MRYQVPSTRYIAEVAVKDAEGETLYSLPVGKTLHGGDWLNVPDLPPIASGSSLVISSTINLT